MQTHVPHPRLISLALVGALTGTMSGLFGIGGGVLLVPLLVAFLGYSQRLAAGTSVAAILPAGFVGGVTYGLNGHVDWIAALALAVGMICGAQLGSYLLSRVPTSVLRRVFIAFLIIVIISLWIVVPQRDATIDADLMTGLLLCLAGVATGTISGLVGIGGGVIIVPILMLFFGASDIIAKGTSLIMLIPGSISGTLGNGIRKNLDLRASLIIGLAASALSPVGALLATVLTPLWSNTAFSVLLAFIVIQMVAASIRTRKLRE